jgi:polar amino acid transport system permease protein
VLPQVFQRVLPPLGNYFIAMFNVTSLAAAITVHELFWTAKDIATRDYRFFEIFTAAGLIYLVVSYPSAVGVRRLEAWLRRSEVRTTGSRRASGRRRRAAA